MSQPAPRVARKPLQPLPLLLPSLLLCLGPLPQPSHGADPGNFYLEPSFARPDYSLYHTKEQVFDAIKTIVHANSGFMRAETLEQPPNATDAHPYNIPLKVVTVEPGGLTSDHSKKLRLLLSYGEHGRELVTVEAALGLLRALADPRAELQRSDARGHGAERLRALLHHAVFKIVPMENTAGRELVERGQLCERKNGRGVDTNRNWGVHWGHKESDYDPSEEFPGTHAFSEPEAASLRDLAEEFRPHVWMNAHSGMEALFMPYDHLAHIPGGEGPQASLRILERLNAIACGGRCAVGCGGKSVGYLAHGTATDYMFEALRVPMAFTWEIYGDATAHYNDCFRMFNPVTQAALDQVVANWTTAVMALLELMPSHPGVPPLKLQTSGRKMDVGAGADVLIYDNVRRGPPAEEHGPRLTGPTSYPKSPARGWGFLGLGFLGWPRVGLLLVGFLGLWGAVAALVIVRRGGSLVPRGGPLGALARRPKGSGSLV